MTIKDCIDIVDNIKPNQYTIKEKVMWLSFIDEIIINEVLKTHEGYDGRYDNFEGYTEDKLSVTLIVPSPYDRLYTAYLKMKIDQENGETARYNNSAILYNSYMSEYRKYYNKTHMPLTIGRRDVMPPRKVASGLSDAEYENLKKDLTFILTEYFSDTVSADRLSAIVTNYVQTNAEMLKGKDGYTPVKGVDYFTENELDTVRQDAKGDDGYSPNVVVSETANGHKIVITDAYGTKGFDVPDGYTPKKGIDYLTEEELKGIATSSELKAVKQELLDAILRLSNKAAPTPASITLYADRWKQGTEENMWYQEVVVANATITEYSKIDLQPSPEQLCIFHEKDLAFVTGNANGTVTVYCIGQKPTSDYTIQATVMEVTIDGE